MKPRNPQGGFSGVLVIVALVLLTSLVSFGTTLMTSALGNYGQELNNARSGLAAEAGLEWGRYQIKRLATPNCPANQLVALPGSLAPYTVTVQCTDENPPGSFTDGALPTVRLYTLRVTACRLTGGGANCQSAIPNADFVQTTLTDWVER